MVRHKVFVSFHHADLAAVEAFVNRFDTGEDAFIYRAITMPDDVINSEDDDYVMTQIRRNYLSDSTVTMVMVGECTWARKFVDWELQASLRRPAHGLPNGLLAVMLDGTKTSAVLPSRLKSNVDTGYANFYAYPASGASLSRWVEDAFQARRTRANLIHNPRARRRANGSCP